MKVGDKVRFKATPLVVSDYWGREGTVISLLGNTCWITLDNGAKHQIDDASSRLEVVSNNKLGDGMKEVLKDFSGFVKEHKSVLYTVALVVIVDHFLLGGKFRAKLQDIMESLLNKAKENLDAKK